jgi:hypothetical protein
MNPRPTVWLPHTVARLLTLATMFAMQTVVILATVAMATTQMILRVVRRPKQPAFFRDGTADE